MHKRSFNTSEPLYFLKSIKAIFDSEIKYTKYRKDIKGYITENVYVPSKLYYFSC